MIAKRTAAFYEKEILKYFVGTEAVKNLVIDATTVTANGDGRYIVEAGSVMVKSGEKAKLAASSGIEATNVIGILAHTVEFFAVGNSAYDEPAAAFFWNAIFDTTKLVNYTSNATAVKAALSSCAFE